MNWSESFFIEIRKKRSLVNYDGPALLLMDGLSVHGNSEFQEMCNENNVIIKFIPAHTSDQIQVLDLGIFANQKRWMHNLNYDDEYTWQTMQVMRMFDSFRMACSPKNIIAAFRRAGMISTYNIKTRVYDVTIDRRYATEVRHWEYQKPVFKPNKNRIQLPI
ncbi:hypothetical protein TRFO_27741 [Tritrichomonas foetus]|nr:hypothetical protein TRFO_27741 [Tritrichomonas foetus]|eukprot:OHT04668.1 hypothetical protein TRFO_27741 [Tritrichomonas foetus]